jgi:hypothetical protein
MAPRGGSAALIAIALSVAACGGSVVADGVTMLRTGLMNGGPTAIANGTLHFRDGCVWLQEAPDVSVVVLWPFGANLDASTGSLAVTLENKRYVEGDVVTLGGGEVNDVAYVRSLVGTIPDACLTARYWLATGPAVWKP